MSASYNRVVLVGNLTRDPEMRYTASGSGVGSFGIAVNEKYKKDGEWVDRVHFFDITVWGKLAESCGEYLHKGSAVFIAGKLDYQTWETDGVKKSKVQVVANTVQFLDKKAEQEKDNISF